MMYVYIIQSQSTQDRYYTGITDNLTRRLAQHNSGKVGHTAKFQPWALKTYIRFSDVEKAKDFETYLKTASGRAFAKKRL